MTLQGGGATPGTRARATAGADATAGARGGAGAPTPQTLDPLGGLTARFFLIATVAIAVGSVIVLLARDPDSVRSPLVQGGALLALATGVVQAVLGADPRFFPFGRKRHLLLQLTLLLAAALDAASREPGPDQFTVWGPTAVALFYVMTGSFRPAREVAVFAFGSAVVVGAITVAHLGDIAPALAVEQVLRLVVPVLAVGAGAAAFSRVLVSRLLAWHAAHDPVPDSARTLAATEVHRDRRDFVDYRVGPFLEGVLESGVLTPVDAARARGLAASLRQQMLRDASRPWLTDVVDSVVGDAAAADVLTAEQRRALGAIIAEVRSADGFVPGSMTARVVSASPLALTVEARLGPARVRVATHRVVLGATFARARVDVEQGAITIALQVDR